MDVIEADARFPGAPDSLDDVTVAELMAVRGVLQDRALVDRALVAVSAVHDMDLPEDLTEDVLMGLDLVAGVGHFLDEKLGSLEGGRST